MLPYSIYFFKIGKINVHQTDSAILTYTSVTSYNKILAKCFLSRDKAITAATSVYSEFLKMSITNFPRKKVSLKLSHSGEGWEELLVQLNSSKSPLPATVSAFLCRCCGDTENSL